MTVWLVIALVGLGTYCFRVSMFLILGRWSLPAWTEQPMAIVGPAAVAALVASLALTSGGRPVAPSVPVTAALIAGFLATRRSGNVMHAFAAGLPAFWLTTALGW